MLVRQLERRNIYFTYRPTCQATCQKNLTPSFSSSSDVPPHGCQFAWMELSLLKPISEHVRPKYIPKRPSFSGLRWHVFWFNVFLRINVFNFELSGSLWSINGSFVSWIITDRHPPSRCVVLQLFLNGPLRCHVSPGWSASGTCPCRDIGGRAGHSFAHDQETPVARGFIMITHDYPSPWCRWCRLMTAVLLMKMARSSSWSCWMHMFLFLTGTILNWNWQTDTKTLSSQTLSTTIIMAAVISIPQHYLQIIANMCSLMLIVVTITNYKYSQYHYHPLPSPPPARRPRRPLFYFYF